jgi:1,4-alpha-glucan branching enzyme
MTLSVWEINEFLRGKYQDPHVILGMHVVSPPGETPFAVARAFVPQADSVTVVDDVTGEEWLAEKVHIEGFFEAHTDRTEWFRYRLRFTGVSGEKWETYDPYAFPPTLSAEDIYLIGEGAELFLYDKLGARPARVLGVKGTVFSAWAPMAEGVSVIGAFNCWDERRGAMRQLDNSGVWEVFSPDAAVGDVYKFSVRRGGIWRAMPDPFGRAFELRPKDASIVADIGSARKPLKKKKPRAKVTDPKTLYVNLGKWRNPDGEFPTYAEITEKLLTAKDAARIVFSPPMEYASDDSNGYETSGYFAPTSRFGTPEGFARMVDELRAGGAAVLLEWNAPRVSDRHGRNFAVASALFWLDKYRADGIAAIGCDRDTFARIKSAAAGRFPAADVYERG